MQKYERIAGLSSASCLSGISQILAVPITNFLTCVMRYKENFPRHISRSGETLDGGGDKLHDPMAPRETSEMTRA